MQQENISIKVGLPELLYGSQGTQLVIPAYQRNYTWVARNKMNAKYDECIANASTPFIEAYLIHNQENLCFE